MHDICVCEREREILHVVCTWWSESYFWELILFLHSDRTQAVRRLFNHALPFSLYAQSVDRYSTALIAFGRCIPTQGPALGVPFEPTEAYQAPLNVSTAAICSCRDPTGLGTCTSQHRESCQPPRKCLEVLNFWTSGSPLPEPNYIASADITL